MITRRELRRLGVASHKTEIEAIRRYCRLSGAVCNVLAQSARLRGSAGIPDLYVQWPRLRRRLWVEVKVGKDRLSANQRVFGDIERGCGGEMIVGGLDELIEWHVQVKGAH